MIDTRRVSDIIQQGSHFAERKLLRVIDQESFFSVEVYRRMEDTLVDLSQLFQKPDAAGTVNVWNLKLDMGLGGAFEGEQLFLDIRFVQEIPLTLVVFTLGSNSF